MYSPDLGPFDKYCARLIAAQRRDMFKALEVAVTKTQDREFDGTGLGELVSWFDNHEHGDALRVIFDEDLDDVTRLFRAVDDQVEAIEVLMGSGRGIQAGCVTLLRGVVEGVLILCSLFEPGASPASLAARHAAYRLESAEGSEKTAIAMRAQMPAARLAEVQAGVDGLHAFFEENGFEIGRGRPTDRYTSWVAIDGVRVSVIFNATDAMKRFLPDEAFEWAIASGAVHSKGWFLPSVVDGLNEPSMADPNDTYSAIVIGLLAASDALLDVLSAHSGADLREFEERTHSRRRAVVSGGRGSGFGAASVDDYRSSAVTADIPPRRKSGSSFLRPPNASRLLPPIQKLH